ncbi:MAG: phosphoribulokinase [Oceanococcus sp.]
MSQLHPIIAVTGSSGAGTSTARRAFEQIFRVLKQKAAFIEGDSFHSYDREQMLAGIQRAKIRGENFSHFGPGANHLDKLEELFAQYSTDGKGFYRHYLHTDEEAQIHQQPVGTFTPWEDLPTDTDFLFYEGLHGGAVTEESDVAQHVDLLIGMTPTINLEWTQKICRDIEERGHTPEDIGKTILRRMPDYVNYITPQFSRTHINFQRVPLVDTSNPFAATEIPSANESLLVVRVARPAHLQVDFPYALSMIHGAHMSRPNTLVVPGGKAALAMEIILRPIIEQMARKRQKLLQNAE